MQSGAWRSDFGGHADEPAHVVTSLMVRDYLAGGFLETWHPMRYAEAYYERFPKVALGHYPPGFYLVASAGLIPFRSGSTLLVLMNCLSAGAGLLVWWFGRRLLAHDGPAIAIAVLYVLLPQTRTDTAIIMASGVAGAVESASFENALHEVLLSLTHQIARDGEGAEKLIEVHVDGARDDDQAKRVAKSIVNSPLVKTAIHGADPLK